MIHFRTPTQIFISLALITWCAAQISCSGTIGKERETPGRSALWQNSYSNPSIDDDTSTKEFPIEPADSLPENRNENREPSEPVKDGQPDDIKNFVLSTSFTANV